LQAKAFDLLQISLVTYGKISQLMNSEKREEVHAGELGILTRLINIEVGLSNSSSYQSGSLQYAPFPQKCFNNIVLF
jgi:hypothetical protein